jgi:hypothetical protein
MTRTTVGMSLGTAAQRATTHNENKGPTTHALVENPTVYIWHHVRSKPCSVDSAAILSRIQRIRTSSMAMAPQLFLIAVVLAFAVSSEACIYECGTRTENHSANYTYCE